MPLCSTYSSLLPLRYVLWTCASSGSSTGSIEVLTMSVQKNRNNYWHFVGVALEFKPWHSATVTPIEGILIQIYSFKVSPQEKCRWLRCKEVNSRTLAWISWIIFDGRLYRSFLFKNQTCFNDLLTKYWMFLESSPDVSGNFRF